MQPCSPAPSADITVTGISSHYLGGQPPCPPPLAYASATAWPESTRAHRWSWFPRQHVVTPWTINQCQTRHEYWFAESCAWKTSALLSGSRGSTSIHVLSSGLLCRRFWAARAARRLATTCVRCCLVRLPCNRKLSPTGLLGSVRNIELGDSRYKLLVIGYDEVRFESQMRPKLYSILHQWYLLLSYVDYSLFT